MEPKEIYLNPNETKQIFVYLHPIKYKQYFSKSNIEAMVIGNLHVENKYRCISHFNQTPNVIIMIFSYSKLTNLFARNAEKDIKPLKISLHANLELPAFDFKYIRGSTEATLDVNHVLNKEKVKFYLRIVFKNTSKNNLTVQMEIDEPFKIVSMKSLATDKTNDTNIKKALVSSETCMEVVTIFLILMCTENTILFTALIMLRTFLQFCQKNCLCCIW